MSETVLCILLVTSSAKGSNLVYYWPPSPQTTPRLARPLPSSDFPGALADNPWRAANSPENVAEELHWDYSALETADDEEYFWERPRAPRNRSLSFDHPPSHPTSRRASPSKDGLPTDDPPHAGTSTEYDTLLGYSAEFLSQGLCPQDSMCHQKFELVVDDLAFIGHPVCADGDGCWRFKQEKTKATAAAARGRGSKKGQSPQDEERLLTPERLERGDGQGLSQYSGMQTFHLVVVLDLPDPSSSASGNISKYFDTIYAQVVFKVTAVLYQEQVLSHYVETECDVLSMLKEEFASRGESHADFMYEALKVSTLAPAMKVLYEAIKKNITAHITLHDIPLELQLPPHLDLLLPANDDVEHEEEYEDEDGEPNSWGSEMSFAWRLPALTPWKALLRLDEEENQGDELYMQYRANQQHPEDRELAEQLIRFLDLANVTLSLAEMASLLDWNLESHVYPAVRWLVVHQRAKIVDIVHPSLKTVFSVPKRFPSPLATLSEEFSRAFAQSGVPPLPQLLAMISTATHKQTANHFYATVVQSKELILLYLEVVQWMLKRDLLIRLHLRIRIIATEDLKSRVRQRWEEHAMRKRSRPRARSISIARGRRAARVEDSDERRGPDLYAVAEGSPVQYYVSLSPKTARKQTRRESLDRDLREVEEDKYDREKHNDPDEEHVSSSADEAEWAEYYKNGGNDNVASIISDPARAKALERRWLACMSEGKDVHLVKQFERINQYFDGKCSDDEILYRAEISRKHLREVLHHYEEYLQTFLHPS